MKSNQKSKSNVGSKVPTSKELLESKLRKMVKSVLKEEVALWPDDVKVATKMINGLSIAEECGHHLSDVPEMKKFSEQIRKIRLAMHEFVENNSDYTFRGKSPNGFNMVKKSK